MSAPSAPYWGDLPDPLKSQKDGAGPTSSAAGKGRAMDSAAQPLPKPNRVSTQTTNTDAPTDVTFSTFASPTSAHFQDQGLAPRPASLPYHANAAFANRALQYSDQNADYRDHNDVQYHQYHGDWNSSLGPGAPDSYRPPNVNAAQYGYPPVMPMSSPQGPPHPDFQGARDPAGGQYYMAGDGASGPHGPMSTGMQNGGSRVPMGAGRSRRPSVSGVVLPPMGPGPQTSGSQRRASGATQIDAAQKIEAFRSPLQKLELTLDSISKEDKRARVAAAEQALCERKRQEALAREESQQQPRQPELAPEPQPQPPQPQPVQPPEDSYTRQLTEQEQLYQPVPVPVPSQLLQRQEPLPEPLGYSHQYLPPHQPDHYPDHHQQVRFHEPSPPQAHYIEPRPLLQPEYSPVESSYIAANNGPLSGYPDEPPPPPPDFEKPQFREAPVAVQAPSSGIPQRNLSFRERAARNDGRIPHTDDMLPIDPDQPTAGPNPIPRRQSSIRAGKLHKDPPANYWNPKPEAVPFDPETQIYRDEDVRQDDYMLSGSVPRTLPVEAAEASRQIQDSVPQPDSSQAMQTPTKTPAALAVYHPAKLVKSPSQRRPQPGVYANAEMTRARAEAANSRGFDGSFDNEGGHRAEAAAAGAAVGAAAAAAASASSTPVRRARFEDDVIDRSNEQSAREGRHFDDPHHHRVSNMVYHGRKHLKPGKGLYQRPEYLDEWKQGIVGNLSGPLLDLADEPAPAQDNKAWWEQPKRRRGSSVSGARPVKAEAFDGEYDEANGPSRFKPPLHLVCGPLLRYCGIRKETSVARAARNGVGAAPSEKEFWRGSVMIVTRDTESSYEIAPMLRLFVQPLELLPPPPKEIQGTLPPEYVDPLVGHPKLGRNGETLYVRPVEQLPEAKDLSRDETDNGLFEKTKSSADGKPGHDEPAGSFSARLKKTKIDGEKAGKFKDVRGFRLHVERGVTFWRFNIEVELTNRQQRIAYRINRGPSTGFWVPAKDQPMHIMFYSCNGFSQSVDTDTLSGPDPLWRDVLNNHQTQPFHVMIGGGDQVYNDAVMNGTQIFRDWLSIRNPISKGNAHFTRQMQDELEAYYLERYAMWFSQGLFSLANSQIPMVNMYDDHDIIDGFGSYPHHFMNSPVFAGLGNVAFKYYMLFQHQSVVGETEESEPSWILGQTPGPYIEEVSRSVFMHLGAKVALLAVDCRTERTRDEVLKDETWKRIIDRCYAEVEKGKTEHLLVQLGVPVAYPRLVWLENILTSRLMEPVKLLGKTGMLGNFLNHFDGGVEILDDLDDHWTAKSHKDERKVVIEDLQDLAADKSVRITILSGDVHLAAIGRFYSNDKQKLAKHKDFRYMPNVVSSAIANTPPPDLLADVLNKRNKVHHFDKETDEDMIPIFSHGVDGTPRNNKTLLPHRNWCSIQPYTPGASPSASTNASEAHLASNGTSVNGTSVNGSHNGSRKTIFTRSSSARNPNASSDPSRPPLSGGGGGLLRRLSGRGRKSVDSVTPRAVSGADGPVPKRSFSLTRPSNLIRRLSSRRRKSPDDGGHNGSWGAGSDEGPAQGPAQGPPQSRNAISVPGATAKPPPPDFREAYDNLPHRPFGRQGTGKGHGGHDNARLPDDQSSVSSVEDIPELARYGVSSSARIRGGGSTTGFDGIGPEYAPNEYENGDESYFSVRRHPAGTGPKRNLTAPDITGGVSGASIEASEGAASGGPPGRPIYRTPTGLKANKLKRANTLEVNLEGGLDIRLNVEVDPKDPSGITVPYRLVVPRLWYTYQPEPAEGARPTGLKRLLSMGRKPAPPPPAADTDEPQAYYHDQGVHNGMHD